MISIVIRNRNEGEALFGVLTILNKEYSDDVSEIILVDNESSDNSVEIAKQFNCKVVLIDNFTYGRAINLGIENSNNNFILLLSSHAIPVGKSFFKQALKAVKGDDSIAGVRFVSSIEDVKRAINNDYEVNDAINYGLTAACCLINKKVWLRHKFNENFIACEDKEWSSRVMNHGFKILNINEAFIYFAKRDQKSFVERYKKEKEANLLLANKKTTSRLYILSSFVKRLTVTNTVIYLKSVKKAFLLLEAELEIYKNMNRK